MKTITKLLIFVLFSTIGLFASAQDVHVKLCDPNMSPPETYNVYIILYDFSTTPATPLAYFSGTGTWNSNCSIQTFQVYYDMPSDKTKRFKYYISITKTTVTPPRTAYVWTDLFNTDDYYNGLSAQVSF